MPHIVSIRPPRLGGEIPETVATFGALAQFMVTSVTEAVRRFTGWNRQRTVLNTRIKLVATNRFNGNDHEAAGHFQTLADITPEILETIFGAIVRSGDIVLLNDVEWILTIVPSSIMTGGSQNVKPPSYVTNLFPTWKGYEGVNCAAFALVYLMYGTRYDYSRNLKRAIKDAKELQEEMGWGEMVRLLFN